MYTDKLNARRASVYLKILSLLRSGMWVNRYISFFSVDGRHFGEVLRICVFETTEMEI